MSLADVTLECPIPRLEAGAERLTERSVYVSVDCQARSGPREVRVPDPVRRLDRRHGRCPRRSHRSARRWPRPRRGAVLPSRDPAAASRARRRPSLGAFLGRAASLGRASALGVIGGGSAARQRPSNPVTWPITHGQPPIADGLQPEKNADAAALQLRRLHRPRRHQGVREEVRGVQRQGHGLDVQRHRRGADQDPHRQGALRHLLPEL